MQGIPVWHKFKNHAAILILRWSGDFAENVWRTFTGKLDALSGANTASSEPQIARATRLCHEQAAAFTSLINEVTGKFSVTEQQLWALLIDRADPEVVTVDVLSDAHDHLLRVAAALEVRDTVVLHAKAAADTKHRGVQKNKAKLPRNSEVDDMIEALAKDRRYQDLSAKELLPLFIIRLEDSGASPEEIALPDRRSRVIYFGKRGERAMLDETFFKKVSSFRSKARNKNSRSRAT
jgi:hypothetical protein